MHWIKLCGICAKQSFLSLNFFSLFFQNYSLFYRNWSHKKKLTWTKEAFGIAKISILHNNVKKGAIGPISKYLPWKLLLDCKNLSTTSEVMEMSLSEVTVISFSMSADVFSDITISLEKLSQNDPWHFEIHPLNQKLWRCQLMCTVTSLLDLPWKTTPKWLLDCQNPSTGSKVIEMSLSMSADVYS